MTSNPSIAARAVIVTADDFGFSREVNAGIIRAHREGILTATSLMVAAAARDEAAALARENPKLDVGLHLVVCRGHSALPPDRLAGIVDASGNFPESPVRAGMRYYFNRDIRARLRDEIRAQIDLHLKLIGRLDHIDGHLNFHVHPVIAEILIDLCTEYRVRCIRLPREPVFTTLALARDHAARKIVEAGIFRALSRRARRLVDSHGMRSTDWLFGLHQERPSDRSLHARSDCPAAAGARRNYTSIRRPISAATNACARSAARGRDSYRPAQFAPRWKSRVLG